MIAIKTCTPLIILVLNIIVIRQLSPDYSNDFTVTHLMVLGFIIATQTLALRHLKKLKKTPRRLFLILYLILGFFGAQQFYGTDHLRYIYDGQVSTTDRNAPFLIAPNSYAAEESQHWWQKSINHPEYKSIYPVGSQIIFLAANTLNPFPAPRNNYQLEFGLRAILFIVCSFAVLFINSRRLAQIFFQPLWLIAAFCNLHIDAVMCVLIYIFLITSQRRKTRLLSTAALIYSIAVKWFSVMYVGFYIKKIRTPNTLKALGVIVSILVGLTALHFLYFGSFDKSYLTSLILYTKHWYFFGPAHSPTLSFLEFINISNPPILARTFCFFIFIGIALRVLYLNVKGRIGSYRSIKLLTLAMLFFSPTNHPWYLLALAPFCRVSRSISYEEIWMNISLVSYLSYGLNDNTRAIELLYSSIVFYLAYNIIKRDGLLSKPSISN